MRGIKARPASSPAVSRGGLWELIDEIVADTDGPIEFTGISQSYDALLLVANLRDARTGVTSDSVMVRVGPSAGVDTASNYFSRWLSSGTGSSTFTSGEFIVHGISTADSPAGEFSSTRVELVEYADTSKLRMASWQSAAAERMSVGGGRWSNSSDPIERIWLNGGAADLVAGSVARLYGIRDVAAAARDWSDGGDPTTVHADWSDGGSPSTVHTDYSTGGAP